MRARITRNPDLSFQLMPKGHGKTELFVRLNMKKAKPEHRREYWKYYVGAHSFELAREVASHLHGMSNADAMFYPLMVSLHVLRHPKEPRRIPPTLVPSDLSSVHEMLLQLRDRIFAHHDKDSRITDPDTGVDLFQLVVDVRRGKMRPAVQMIFPTNFQLGKVKALCDHLCCICMRKADEALIKCIGVVPNDGIYRVSTDFEGRAPLLIRSELSTEQSGGHLKETKRRTPDLGG
jgi:hypothetical protein